MARYGLLLALTVCVVSPTSAAEPSAPNRLSAEELAEGWILLFDGEGLFGWRASSEANWAVEDGAIRVDQGAAGLLRTTSQFGDFTLDMEVRGEGNLVFRSPPVPADPVTKCYKMALSGSKAGSLLGRWEATDSEIVAPRADGWSDVNITAEGGSIRVAILGGPDGNRTLTHTDPRPLGRGYIGLEFTGGPLAVRNVKFLPAKMTPIFNGRDLSGWKTYPDMASRFTVTDEGWLNVRDGRGQLETDAAYGDFTLQAEVFVNGKALNSGIFYRCIPGETMNGYESQIHNGFDDGDRTKPTDCGTGGIFRRQNARRVVADDFTWFHKTLHVDGRHVAAWVNGIQVSDWTDTREPDPNPRRGLRLEPGTLQIQGHDPTTDLSFRNLRIAELPKR